MAAVALPLLQVETVAVDTSRLNLLFALLVIAVVAVGLSAVLSSGVWWSSRLWVNAGVTVVLFVALGYYVMEYHYLERGYFLINFV